ncbi:thioredoxin family protein [Marinovum sp.]|uniref:thioredoxin family protein n=1 Tax=Marinovum sp. TaxID=2024839 RepID=UPI002B26ED20|nr:thioredoxin family protein [Marinovum sp.]
MQRRDFLILGAAGAASATLLPLAAAAEALQYKTGMLQQRLNAGETLFLDFTASWCSTCRAQARVIDKLKAENPAYAANITFIDIDWDTYGSSQMATRMRIPRRSTLVVLKGDEELGRIVAETREERIRELLDVALDAATTA